MVSVGPLGALRVVLPDKFAPKVNVYCLVKQDKANVWAPASISRPIDCTAAVVESPASLAKSVDTGNVSSRVNEVFFLAMERVSTF